MASINVPKIRKITKDKIIKDVAVVKTEETLDTTKVDSPCRAKIQLNAMDVEIISKITEPATAESTSAEMNCRTVISR